MKWSNKTNQSQNKGHSFYKEAKKSFASESQFSGQKALKMVTKYSKWALYGFLVTATLWGCVNQFRHKTSRNVSQGIEFYRDANDTWSNLYGSQQNKTYQKYNDGSDGEEQTAFRGTTNYEVWTNDDSNNVESELNNSFQGMISTDESIEEATHVNGPIGVIENLDFWTFNPNFSDIPSNDLQEKKKNGYGPDTNTENVFVRVGELTNQLGTPTPRTYSKQATTEDFLGFLVDVMLVDWESSAEDMKNNYVVVNNVLPNHLQKTNSDDSRRNINTWSRYIWDKNGLVVDPEGKTVKEEDLPLEYRGYFLTHDVDGEELVRVDSEGFGILDTANHYLSYNANNIETTNFEEENIIFIPKLNTSSHNFNILEDDEKINIITSQVKFSMNTTSFNLGKNIDQTEKVISENEGGEKDFVTIWENALKEEGLEIPSTGFTYKAILPSPLNSEGVTSGTELFTYAQTRDNQLRPSPELVIQMENDRKKAIRTINEQESTNYKSWKDLPTNNGTGADLRTDNAGWAILNEDSEIVTIETKEKGSNKDREEESLWALTRALNRGSIVDNTGREKDLNGIQIDEENFDLVFDEKVKQLVMDDSIIETSKRMGIGVGSKQEVYITTDEESKFLGVKDITEVGYFSRQRNYVSPINQKGGESQALAWNRDREVEGDWTVQKFNNQPADSTDVSYWRNELPTEVRYSQSVTEMEGSKITSAISASGESGTNESRVIFAGWSDWGRAWDPDFGPMHGVFVFPIAMVSTEVISWMPYSVFGAWGVLLGMFIIVFSLRGFGALLSWKSQDSQMKMQETQTEIAMIKSKYEQYDKSNKKMKQKQQQETMALYKKKGINPFQSFGTLFLTMPIFLSMYIIISSIVTYKIAAIGVFQFGVSAFTGMFNIGSMFAIYLLIGVAVGLSQGVSSKLPSWLADKRNGVTRVDEATKAARKKQGKTQNIMIGVFVFIGLTIPVLLAFYWIISAMFTMTLEIMRHLFKIRKAKKKQEA